MFKKLKNYKFFILLGLSVSLLSGCAGVASLPGSGETTNAEFYKTNDDFLAILDKLTPGMSQSEVFSILQRKREDFIALDRSQLLAVIYGSSETKIQNNNLLQSLYGYNLAYKTIESSHGFSSPIRIRTDKSGYSYKVSLIFHQGFLFEKPIISGGLVNKSSSSTIFDYITPSKVLDHVVL